MKYSQQIVQAVAGILFLCIVGCGNRTVITKTTSENYTFNDSLVVDEGPLTDLLAPYKNTMDSTMSEVLNTSELEMTSKGNPESLLGNFVADLTLKMAFDKMSSTVLEGTYLNGFCLLNTGGLRSSLPKGNITRGKLYELMPFENELVVLTLSGQKIQTLFDYVTLYKGQPISGATFAIRNKKAIDIKINGKPFDVSKSYRVITTDYLANGGDKMTFFKAPIKRKPLDLKLRDAILQYVMLEKEAGRALTSKLDGRIYYDK
jgi:2',3'-cyclic-nucleotide 2'-phosphodiesterase (5'-nucleotidase family)